MSKVLPKITSVPQVPRVNTGGAHNTEVGKHESGIAPKPRGGAPILGNTRPTLPPTLNMARAGSTGTGNPQGRLPLQSPPANVVGRKIGQPNPDTSAAATAKPKRKGIGANFYGEY